MMSDNEKNPERHWSGMPYGLTAGVFMFIAALMLACAHFGLLLLFMSGGTTRISRCSPPVSGTTGSSAMTCG